MVENKTIALGLVFTLSKGIIIAEVLLPTIANKQGLMTIKMTYVNDTEVLTSCYAKGKAGQVNTSNPSCNLTLTEVPDSWKVNNCPLASLTIKNSTGVALTVNTDYTFSASTGVVSYLNDSNVTASTGIGAASNTTYATYSFCDDGYIISGSARSITKLILIFAGLAMLAFAIYFVMKKLREM